MSLGNKSCIDIFFPLLFSNPQQKDRYSIKKVLSRKIMCHSFLFPTSFKINRILVTWHIQQHDDFHGNKKRSSLSNSSYVSCHSGNRCTVCMPVCLSICLLVCVTGNRNGADPTLLLPACLVMWHKWQTLHVKSHVIQVTTENDELLEMRLFSWRFLLNLIQRQMPNQPGQILNKLRKLKIWLFGKISLFPFDSQAVDIM